MESLSGIPADNTEGASNEPSDTDTQTPSVEPEAFPSTTTQVVFDITVPAYMSDELQVRLDWGDVNLAVPWVRDENWVITEFFPANTENPLVVTFADRNGAITLGSYETTFRTGEGTSETIQIMADQFNTRQWDDDNNGVSNLNELIAGTSPNGDDLPQAAQASLEILPVKTFRITWQTTPGAQYYRVLENPDGSSGFTDISGDLEANATRFDYQVALFSRINALYLIQSCNEQDCVDSEPVMVTDELENAIGYFKTSNPGGGDKFGQALSISEDGTTLAVGAPAEDSLATGANGLQADNSVTDSGAVYVFVRNGYIWQQQAYLKASNTGRSDRFGSSVSLSSNGNTLSIGAPWEASAATGINGDQSSNSRAQAGAVYVFERSNGLWQQQVYLKASNTGGAESRFGSAVSLSADGDTLAVAASDDNTFRDGADVYIFVRSNQSWQQQAYIEAVDRNEDNLFGGAISLSADGNTLSIGAPWESSAATGINGDQNDNSMVRSGAVYVYIRSGDRWQQQAFIKASNTGTGDQFGSAVAMSANGNTLAVGAPLEKSETTGVNGDQSNDQAPNAGAVYVFVRNDGIWQQEAYVKASNTGAGDRLGETVSLSADGNTLAFSATGEDSESTGLNGDENVNFFDVSGAAYIFIRNGLVWQQQAYVKASNTGRDDDFGSAIGLSGDGKSLAVGAIFEDSAATGINGDQNDNSLSGSGAVYLF